MELLLQRLLKRQLQVHPCLILLITAVYWPLLDISTTICVFDSVVDGLTKLLARAEQVHTCYKKYCISVDVLEATFSQVSAVLDSLEYTGSSDDLKSLSTSLTDCQENLKRRHNCLNTMHDQVAEIEALTFTLGEFNVEATDRR